jgi:hypothetical protein
VPQLFLLTSLHEGSEPVKIPSTCAKADLVAEVAPPAPSSS